MGLQTIISNDSHILSLKINFSVPIKTDLDNDKAIIYKLKFIDSYRFMQGSLSSFVDNLSEINKKKPTDEFID